MKWIQRIAVGAGFWLAVAAHAFVPQSGNWVVTSELNGEPGRGMAMDVQGNTLVMQMYAYERTGQPTFYMASGTLTNNRLTTKLGRYSGGRYLGSTARSGVEDGSPGQVTLRFTSGVTGFMTLPGETEVAIQRYEFGLSRSSSELSGVWLYVAADEDDEEGDIVALSSSRGATSGGTGLMVDPAKQIGCEYRKNDDGPYNMYCGYVSGSSVTWVAKIRVVGQEGEGIGIDSAGRTTGVVYVRKLRDGSGKFLGLFQ
jgi:hypothetical protein